MIDFAEVSLECREHDRSVSDDMIRAQWDEMIERQHQNPKHIIMDKDNEGELLLRMLGRGKRILRSVKGEGTRSRDVTKTPLNQPVASGSDSRRNPLHDLFSNGGGPSRSGRKRERSPNSERGGRESSPPPRPPSVRGGGRAADDDLWPDILPEDSASHIGADDDGSSVTQPRKKLMTIVGESEGVAKLAADGKTLNSVEYLKAKVGMCGLIGMGSQGLSLCY